MVESTAELDRSLPSLQMGEAVVLLLRKPYLVILRAVLTQLTVRLQNGKVGHNVLPNVVVGLSSETVWSKRWQPMVVLHALPYLSQRPVTPNHALVLLIAL
jgi:hypothetical protein